MTADSERTGFMNDIIAHRADDVPRLIFADWLDDHGEPERAAFIRVQAEASRRWRLGYSLGSLHFGHPKDQPMDFAYHATCSCDWCMLRRRERELMLSYWMEWNPPRVDRDNSFELILSDKWAYTNTPGFLFRRGFVAEIRCPLSFWLTHGPAIAKAHPVELVAAMDKEPQDFPESLHGRKPGRYYGWANAHAHEVPSDHPDKAALPRALFLLLAGFREDSTGNWKTYGTESLARAALSDALIALAESGS